jgi:hypothetical protein
MRRIVLAAASILATTFAASAQSEDVTIEAMRRPQNRVLFIARPTADDKPCESVDASRITPQVAPRLGRTIFAESLVYNGNVVGYVYLISHANGPHEVYFASFTQDACTLKESQTHKRVFVGETRFDEAKSYYQSLFNELSE